MKDKSSRLKQLISMVSCMTRAKCIAVRSKTDAMRARLMLTSLTLLSKKKSFSIAAITAKINHIFHHHHESGDEIDQSDDPSKAIVLYSSNSAASCCKDISSGCETIRKFYDDDDDKYPDLRHSLFEEEEKELAELLDDPDSSISAIDMVKNSKESGESFNLEDDINQVADLFITKFHKRMRLQKLLSFKRYQQMLDKSDSTKQSPLQSEGGGRRRFIQFGRRRRGERDSSVHTYSPTSAGFNTDQLPFNTSQNYTDGDDMRSSGTISKKNTSTSKRKKERTSSTTISWTYEQLGFATFVFTNGDTDGCRDLDQIMADQRAAKLELDAKEARVSQRKLPQLLHDQDDETEIDFHLCIHDEVNVKTSSCIQRLNRRHEAS
ncbi:hypothetical protein SASPL_107413 [Salvia splendens]|uniref:Uncharacterized protein n=1 Tax=Salvia splendens TaxID=180675 RepID=A0A8X8YGS7_SALSN|nr:hypothetical protein SASPL_107413 [Salvia splendens]